ncbi:MAG TPA: hypothetical protein PLU10_08715 [Chitinophagaceae bacterium]|nr:hypothetical protein [Chitinophagaceae bacterium]
MDLLNQLHALLRWVVLILIISATLRAFMGMQAKKGFTSGDQKSGLFLMIACDLQLLIGLILYVAGPWGIKNIRQIGMSAVMKDGYSRFFAVEHILMMVVAIVLVHMGRAKAKKLGEASGAHKVSFIYYVIAFIIMMISIPWPFRKGFEALGWM